MTSVSCWRHVTVTVWTPRFLTDWASCRRSEPGAKLRGSAQATSLGDKSEALSWHLMPDWPMTLRGETPVWVTYSPVTHLPTDGWVTVMLVHMKQRQLCLQRAVQTHAMLISSPIRWDESDLFCHDWMKTYKKSCQILNVSDSQTLMSKLFWFTNLLWQYKKKFQLFDFFSTIYQINVSKYRKT